MLRLDFNKMGHSARFCDFLYVTFFSLILFSLFDLSCCLARTGSSEVSGTANKMKVVHCALQTGAMSFKAALAAHAESPGKQLKKKNTGKYMFFQRC